MHYYVVFHILVCFRIIAEAKAGFLFSRRGVPIILSCVQKQCVVDLYIDSCESTDLGIDHMI